MHGGGFAQIKTHTYLVMIAPFTGIASWFLRRSRTLIGSIWTRRIIRLHRLEETPIASNRQICDDLFFAGLRCWRFRCALLLLLILSLLCLPTCLWTTACLMLKLSLSSVAPLFAHPLVPATLVVGLLTSTLWISSVLPSSVRSTRLLHL